MTWSIDTRIPVLFGTVADAGADDALLIAGDGPAPACVPVARYATNAAASHVAGCACCLPQGAVAAALRDLFLRRARGEVAFFRRVVAVPGGEAVRAAVEWDPLAAARFRLV